MTDENQDIVEHDDDSFDAFADAIDNRSEISEVDRPQATTDENSDDEHNGRSRDELGRFASEGNDEEDETTLPEAAKAVDGKDWQKEAQSWEHRYKSDLGRQSALQRKIAEQEQLITQLQKDRSQDNPEGSGLSDAEWESLKNDFPEMAAAVEARINSISSRYESQLSQLHQTIQPIQQQAEDQYRSSQMQILSDRYPDWQDTARSDDFKSWVSQQPYQVQQLMASDNAADAGWMLDQYKLSRGLNQKQQQQDELKAKREQQLRSAQTVSRRGVVNQDLESDDALFDHYANLADKAKRRA